MQVNMLTNQHLELLKNRFGISKEVFLNMSKNELDNLVDEHLIWIEADEADNNLPTNITLEGALAADLIDIIYGNYSFEKSVMARFARLSQPNIGLGNRPITAV